MTYVTLTLPSDGDTVDASDVNNPLNAIATVVNGNLDNSNIKSGAAIDRSKIAGITDGWENFGQSLTNITALGNRSYTADVTGVDTTGTTSVGQRLKLPRTVTAPTQCTDLEQSSSQYFSKTSPAGLSFTTTFTCSAWIKLESYSVGGIIGRRNADVEGWNLHIDASGRVVLNALRIAVNNKSITSTVSVPLNKWVHIAATMDVSAGDTSAQKIWIDGVDQGTSGRIYILTGVCAALVQGTTALTVGALKSDGSNPFDGKIAQAAVFSTQLSDATVKAMMNQTMTGAEAGQVSGFTLSNSLNDLNANANNLTANGGALATNTDTPFTNSVTGTSVTAGTTNYGIIMAQTFSTNTTYTIQIPEGETLPTTGGIGTVSYSTQKTPYGFPGAKGKWLLYSGINVTQQQSSATANTWYNLGSMSISIPVGEWVTTWSSSAAVINSAGNPDLFVTLSKTNSTEDDFDLSARPVYTTATTNASVVAYASRTKSLSTTTVTTYYLNAKTTSGGSATIQFLGGTSGGTTTITCENAYL